MTSDGQPISTSQDPGDNGECDGADSSIASNPSTERVRLFRERRRRGLTPVTIELYAQEVTYLVTLRLLDAADRADRNAIGAAIGKLLDRAFPMIREGRLKGP